MRASDTYLNDFVINEGPTTEVAKFIFWTRARPIGPGPNRLGPGPKNYFGHLRSGAFIYNQIIKVCIGRSHIYMAALNSSASLQLRVSWQCVSGGFFLFLFINIGCLGAGPIVIQSKPSAVLFSVYHTHIYIYIYV